MCSDAYSQTRLRRSSRKSRLLLLSLLAGRGIVPLLAGSERGDGAPWLIMLSKVKGK